MLGNVAIQPIIGRTSGFGPRGRGSRLVPRTDRSFADRYRSLPGCSIVGIAVTRVRTSHGFTEAARLGCLAATACKPTVASYQSENKSRGIQWSVGRRNAGTWDVSRISFASTAPHAPLCSARYAPSVRAHSRAPLGA